MSDIEAQLVAAIGNQVAAEHARDEALLAADKMRRTIEGLNPELKHLCATRDRDAAHVELTEADIPRNGGDPDEPGYPYPLTVVGRVRLLVAQRDQWHRDYCAASEHQADTANDAAEARAHATTLQSKLDGAKQQVALLMSKVDRLDTECGTWADRLQEAHETIQSVETDYAPLCTGCSRTRAFLKDRHPNLFGGVKGGG